LKTNESYLIKEGGKEIKGVQLIKNNLIIYSD